MLREDLYVCSPLFITLLVLAWLGHGCGGYSIRTGPPGPQGLPGTSGTNGQTGPKGDSGDAGPQGPIGDTGNTGPSGATGATGAAGSNGADGTSITPIALCPTVTGGIGLTESLLKIGTEYYAVYYDGSHAALVPLHVGSYVTTDGRSCHFSIGSDGLVHQ